MIVGLGNIGMGYDFNIKSSKIVMTHCKAFSLHPNFNIVAGVDKDIKKKPLFEKRFKASFYTSIKIALKNYKPEIVVIAVNTKDIVSVFYEIIGIHKPSLLLVEKPISYDYLSGLKIFNYVKKHKINFFVNYIRSADPNTMKLKKLIENEKSNPNFSGSLYYSRGLYNNASHFINLLEFLFGSVKKIQIIKKNKDFNRYDPQPNFILEFEKGSITVLYVNTSIFDGGHIDLVINKKKIYYNCKNGNITYENQSRKRNSDSEIKIIKGSMADYQMNVVKNLDNFLKNKKSIICDGQSALITLKIISNIHRKLK